MPEGTVPLLIGDSPVTIDRRLLVTTYNSFATEAFVPQTLEEHRARCAWVRERLLLSAGLKPALDIPVGKIWIGEGRKYQNIIIKPVSIESLPGLKLTGSLFLQEDLASPVPGILCPHGHWQQGRVHHAPNGGVVKRCCEMARLGFAVFAYDMIGYNDCNDFPHRWQGELKRKGDLAGISNFGLQTLNSMRAVDFLCSLPEVDSTRIACTGASGGGSQTWFIAALDERIKVAAPVCMLSSHFQGGCVCEEGPLLRTTGLTSFDIVSALAPRPLMLPGVTGDWTNLNPVYEIPRLKQVYSLYHAEDQVESCYFEDGHNYNQRTREHIYAWLVRQLKGINCGSIIAEDPEDPPAPEVLWHEGKAPAAADENSINCAYAKLADVFGRNILDTGSDFSFWQANRRKLLAEILENGQAPAKDVVQRVSPVWSVPGGKAAGFIVSRRMAGDMIPTVQITPDKAEEDNAVTLLAASGDYREYFADGALSGFMNALVKKGRRVRLVELTGSGSRAWQLEKAVRNAEMTTAAFDEPYFTMRVQDLVTVSVLLKERGFKDIRIAAEGKAVPVALAAGAVTGLPVAVDLKDVDETVWDDPVNHQPLIGRAGGLAGLLLLNIRRGSVFGRPGKDFRTLLKKYGAEIVAGDLKKLLS